MNNTICKFFSLPLSNVKLDGVIDQKIRLIVNGVLKNIDMKALADYFRNLEDGFAAGEFWGKLMRASCMLCAYTGDSQLRKL